MVARLGLLCTGMSACKLRLEPDEQNPDLFFFKPLEAAGRVAVSAAAGRRTSRFFLDPKGRLTREVGDWLHLAERCYLGGTPVPPLYINGLVKVGGQGPYCVRVYVQQMTARGYHTSLDP